MIDVTDVYGETKDNIGQPGDLGFAYVFGNPRAGLTLLVQARLTIMRGYVLDASHADFRVRYGDDSDYVHPTESGLFIPATANWPDEA